MAAERKEVREDRKSPWFWPLVGTGLIALAGLAGWLLSPGAQAEYLPLQQLSDRVHRLAVLLLPGCLSALLLAWLMKRASWRWPARVLVLAALPGFCGMLVYIVRFDSVIEERGVAGQWIRQKVIEAKPGPVAGPWIEEPGGPGLTSPPLEDGSRLILDRRTLTRRSADGSYRWNRPRPGRHPAQLLICGNTILFAGGGADFEDDLVVAAVDLESGALHWSFHTLGNWIGLSVKNRWLALAASRPSISTVTLLDWIRAERAWSTLVEGRVPIRPRLEERSLRVASRSVVYELSLDSGAILESRQACDGHPGVVCERGRVVGWTP